MTQLAPTFNIYLTTIRPKKVHTIDVVENKVKMVVEQITGIPYSDYSVKRRKKELVFPRQLYSYLMYHYTPLTLEAVGVRLKPDKPFSHDNIIHSRSVIESILSFDRHVNYKRVTQAIELMEGFKKIKESTNITNKNIATVLRKRRQKL